MSHEVITGVAIGLLAAVLPLASKAAPPRLGPRKSIDPGSGALLRVRPNGEVEQICPLKHTDVQARIDGFFSRVIVTQQFENPSAEKIEGVYVFPLPADAAVDEMIIHVGDRVIRSQIKRRDEARAIYQKARDAGLSAALLDQERPNIFTQSVANIRPGEKVKVELRYVETLPFEDGSFRFTFPMVVGPRYTPHGGDPSRITPPVAAKGTRAGHDISLAVDLDAGLSLYGLRSKTHAIEISRASESRVSVKLRDGNEIPNRDFVLQYELSGKAVGDAILTHRDARGGFFSLILQPPAEVHPADLTPRELVFVLDTSGSMSGFPIEKAKETMRLAMHDMNPRDTFNLITFSGDTRILFPRPVPATGDNVRMAESFLASRPAGGGTEMMQAIRAALDSSDHGDRVRVVCFMTDGYVGNDLDVIAEVQKHANARVFAFGIGSSVNHFLLDKVASVGRGEVEYVGLEDDGSAAARRFFLRVRNPLLTDVSVEWNGLPVSDIYPQRIPDLFSVKPVVLFGRYNRAAQGDVHLRGKIAGRPFSRDIAVNLPETEPHRDVLPALWARRKVDDLMSLDWSGMESGRMKGEAAEAITKLGLEYHLATQFTSFVAVEERTVTEGGRPRGVEVPVEMPQGLSHEGVFGGGAAPLAALNSFGSFLAPMSSPTARLQVLPAVEKVNVNGKLDPVLLAKIRNGRKDDKVNVLILLSDSSPATLRLLESLGFEKSGPPNSAHILAGRIAVAKLVALAKIPQVRNIAAL